MPMLVDADMRGICALRDEEGDTVLLWFEDLVAVHGDPAAPGPDVSFDEAPWAQLPGLQELWDPAPPFAEMLKTVSAAVHTDLLLEILAEVDVDYEARKGRDGDSSGKAVDDGGFGADAVFGSSAAGGGGASVPGGSENGDAVGEGGQAGQFQNDRPASKVPRRRGPGKASRGRKVDEPVPAENP